MGFDSRTHLARLRLRAGHAVEDREPRGQRSRRRRRLLSLRPSASALDAEVSDGDLGAGGKLGTNYLLSERTNLYLNYALENERTDNGLRSAGAAT